jgi:CUG-BP- and ETR3-like factor
LLQSLLVFPLQGAPSSKGCGLVAFTSRDSAAAAAIEVLCNKYIWPGMRSPMVVKLIASHPGKPSEGGSSSSGYSYGHGSRDRGFVRQYDVPGMYGRESRMYGVGARDLPAAAAGTIRLPHQDVLPRGCAPDADKLFVGNIPKTCTERELRQVRWRQQQWQRLCIAFI